MSWRLWNRETFCCDSKPDSTVDLTQAKPSTKDIPELSSSVSSAGSFEGDRESPADSDSDSPLSKSRGKEKHITPKRLEQLVVNIKEKTVPTPLSPAIAASVAALADTTPRPSSPTPARPIQAESPEPRSTRSSDSQYSSRTLDSDSSVMPANLPGSDTSVSSTVNTHSPTIVHGFSPSVSSRSHKSKTSIATQSIKSSHNLAPPKAEAKRNETKFIIGNGSMSDDESSFEERLLLKPQRSSLTEGLSKVSIAQPPKKQASFREILDSRPMDSEDAIESDDESVIDEEDDDSSWEDSDNESQSSSMDDNKPMFQRVDSRPNLTSRRSLLTTALTQGDRATALQRAAMAAQSSPNLRRSRRSSPIGPSIPPSPEKEPGLTMRGPPMPRGQEIPRSKPIIVTTTNTHPVAHSPRTTRRNMLSTELTESLRKHLLWERQPRGGMANAAFKRSHTTQNMGNLRDKAQKAGPSDTSKTNSWNNYFDFGPAEYNAKGW